MFSVYLEERDYQEVNLTQDSVPTKHSRSGALPVCLETTRTFVRLRSGA